MRSKDISVIEDNIAYSWMLFTIKQHNYTYVTLISNPQTSIFLFMSCNFRNLIFIVIFDNQRFLLNWWNHSPLFLLFTNEWLYNSNILTRIHYDIPLSMGFDHKSLLGFYLPRLMWILICFKKDIWASSTPFLNYFCCWITWRLAKV